MFSTLKLLGTLSPGERKTILSGQFAGDFTADALLDQMRALARFDASNDAARDRIKRLTVISVIFAIATTWLGFNQLLVVIPGFDALARPLPFAIAGLSVACFIALLVLKRRLTSVDISNNFRDVALPFLAVLKQDIDPDQLLSVRIDLRSPTHERKRRDSSHPAAKGRYTKIVETNYHDPWFHGAARLADGSVLRWGVTEDICKSERTKRSASNKLKTKTRHYKRSAVAISLAVPNKSYGVNAGLQSSRHKVSVEKGAKRGTIKLTRKIKSKSLDALDPRVLIDAVSSAYKRVAAPARSAA